METARDDSPVAIPVTHSQVDGSWVGIFLLVEPVIHLGFVGLTSNIPTIRIYMHGPSGAGLRQA